MSAAEEASSISHATPATLINIRHNTIIVQFLQRNRRLVSNLYNILIISRSNPTEPPANFPEPVSPKNNSVFLSISSAKFAFHNKNGFFDMQKHRKWPLVVAVSSALLISGCLGGGGGSNGSGDAPAGGAGNESEGGENGTPAEDSSTVTTYTVTLNTPQLIGSAEHAASNLGRLATAISQLIAPYAQAQTTFNPRPADVRVALMRGDNNGTPDDPSDDADLYLNAGQDYSVESSDGVLTVQLPFRPRVDHYIEIASGGASSLSVPTYQTRLVADPISTFITHMLASRAVQLDQLNVEEVDELVEEIRLLSTEPEMREVLALAYASANSTQALIDALNGPFFTIVDARLEDSAAPPVGNAARATINGDYYFQSFGLGSFSADQSEGLLGSGTARQASLALTNNGRVRASVGGSASSRYDAVHHYNMYASTEVRSSIIEEPTALEFLADSRGMTVPQSLRKVPCSQVDLWGFRWIDRTDGCLDQQHQSQQRLIAAGPTQSPFTTLVGSAFATRQVGEGNNVQLREINGSVEIGIKKPNSTLPVSGEYGVLEITHTARTQFGLDMKLIDASHSGQEVSYCERAFRGFSKPMSSEYGVNYYPFDNDDCISPNGSYTYKGHAYFGPKGALDLLLVGGFSSADGLTYMAYRQTPNDRQMAHVGQTRVLGHLGERVLQIGVKRDVAGTSLAKKRYRLMSVGAGVSQYMMEADRFLAGTLTFDESGQPTLQAAVQSERILDDRVIQSQPNRELHHRFQNHNLQEGRLWMSIGSTPDDVMTTTTLAGYVQQGGRLLLLWREVVAADGYKSIGPVLGVCTNCD